MKFYVVFGILATLALQAIAEETKEAATTAATDRVSSVTKTNFLNDAGAKWGVNNYGTALATGGIVIVGVVVLLAIAAVISPLFGYKLCQIFSTCDNSANAGYAGDVYSAGFASSPYSTYQKRSLEYLGPILQTLNSAYEKYGHGVSPMNIKKVNSQ